MVSIAIGGGVIASSGWQWGCAEGSNVVDAPLDSSTVDGSPSSLATTTEVCTGAFAIADNDVFSSQQRAMILDAFRRWNQFVGRDLVYFYASARCRITTGSLDDGYVGYHAQGTITIDLARAPSDPTWFVHLVMHEIGHVLGLNHVAHGVMGENNTTATPDFTPDDRHECQRVNVCP